MRTKIALVSCIALFAILAMFSVSASDLSISEFQIDFNGMNVDAGDTTHTLTAFAGERIPLEVLFTAREDLKDARVMAWVSGHKDEIFAETDRFQIFPNHTYDKLLVLDIPSYLEDLEQELTLVVWIDGESKSHKEEFKISLERESYKVSALSIEVSPSAKADEHLEIDVVAKNIGLEKLEDVFAVFKVPELGLQKTVYMSDLFAVDHTHEDEEDAAERSVLLGIPEDATAGTYSLEVVIHNADTSTNTIKKEFKVVAVDQRSEVLVPINAKTATVGEEVTYDLIILNRGSKTAVYEITPEVSGSAFVSVDQPIVTVSGDSSNTVKVKFTAQEAGTYTFGVNVNSEGNLVKKANLVTTVEKTAKSGTAITSDQSIVVLTIVLAIIFVVLLVVLLVLLTRKPKKEAEETYY